MSVYEEEIEITTSETLEETLMVNTFSIKDNLVANIQLKHSENLSYALIAVDVQILIDLGEYLKGQLEVKKKYQDGFVSIH